jgi:hypothetical protein
MLPAMAWIHLDRTAHMFIVRFMAVIIGKTLRSDP